MKKKVLLPSLCFAVLSTAAFDQVVQAAENSTPVSTAAQANITQYVKISPGSNLNLRATASTSAAILASLANGTQVSVHSNENGWAKISANGKTGFVSSKFLATKNGGSSSSPAPVKEEAKTSTQYVNVQAGSKLNLRAAASASSSILSSLASGTKVSVHSIENGWAKISANGKTGFVSSNFLTTKNGGGSSSAPAPVKEEAKTSTQYVNVQAGSKLNVRASASTSAAILSSLAKDTKVSVLSVENGWAKITVNGKTGYVSSNFLTTKNGGGSSSAPAKEEAKTSTQYVNVQAGSRLNLRASASTSAAILSSLAKDTKVSVLSVENGWAKISANGKTGFVSSNFLTTKNGGGSSSAPAPVKEEAKTSTQYVNVKAGSKLNVRASASTSAAVLSSLAKDTKVSVLSVENGWAKITVNGKTGFVSTNFLTTKNDGGSSSAPAPAKEEAKTSTQYVNVQAGSKLNLRASASTSAAILSSLAKDTKVSVHSTANGWAKITVNGKTGFVSTNFLTTKNSGGSSSAPAKEETKTSTQYVNVQAGSKLNLRSSASTSASILSSLAKDTKVSVHSIENGWAKITANGKTGFVSSEFLSATKAGSTVSPPPIKEEAVIKKVNVSSKSSLNMRTKPNAKASIIVKLASGVQVTVLSEENGWAKIKVYGQEGYVSAEFLSKIEKDSTSKDKSEEQVNSPEPSPVTDEKEEPVTEPVETTPAPSEQPTNVKYVNVQTGSSLNMRSKPSTSGSIITKLSKGTPVTVKSEENGWAQVTANGETGYISVQYLTDKLEGSQDPSKRTVKTINTQYDVTLDEFTQMQLKTNPQTDKKYTSYIREDALILNDPSNPTTGKVQGTGWKIRGGASTSDWVIGTVKNGEFLQIISSKKGSDGYIWYQVNYSKSWVNASPEDVKKQLDPKNHINDPVASLQFLKLSENTDLDQFEVNEKILAGKGVLTGHAATFATASKKYGVNDVYLISHALLETGNGTSQLAKGVEIYGKTVYNMFGIGAYDKSAVSSGAHFAYNEGWFTPEAAIMGGAKFIAQGYIQSGQDTLYKMRWNPEKTIANGVGSHQYATDIGWATKQVYQIHNLYSLLDSYKVTLEIPTFKY